MSYQRSKQAGILTTAEFIRFGFKSLVGIILARILTPAELGSYRQLFLIYTTFSTLLLLGIPQSVMVLLPKLRHIDSKREYISKVVNLITILAFVFSLAIFAFRHLIADKFHNPGMSNLLVLFAVYPLFMFITQIYSALMLGLKQPQKTARFTIFSVVTDTVLILGLAILTKSLAYTVLGVMLSAFSQWCFAHYNLVYYKTKVGFDVEFLRDLLQYSLPLGLSSIIGMLSIQLDKFVISGFFRPADFAVFSIGAMELPFVSILSNSVNSILLPHISSDTDNLATTYRAAVRKNALIVLPLCVIFFILAKPLITLLYTSQYEASVPIFRVYLLILPLRIATFGIIFMALGKTKYIMYNAILTLLLNLVLNLILVRQIGMIGAALATVLVTWISAGVYLYWIKHKLSLSLAALFPCTAILRTALAAVIAGAFAYFTIQANPGYLFSALSLLVFIVSYVIFGYLLKAILPYDFQLLKELLLNTLRKSKIIA